MSEWMADGTKRVVEVERSPSAMGGYLRVTRVKTKATCYVYTSRLFPTKGEAVAVRKRAAEVAIGRAEKMIERMHKVIDECDADAPLIQGDEG